MAEDSSEHRWSLETGQATLEKKGGRGLGIGDIFNNRVFKSSDKKFSVKTIGNKTLLLDYEKGTETIIEFKEMATAATFSTDNAIVAIGYESGIIKLWNTKSIKEIQSFQGHRTVVSSIAFMPDGKTLITSSYDTTTRLWDIKTSREKVKLITTSEGDWVVIDAEGRFDASEGALKLMHYSYGLDVINLEQFKDEYFEPGLLQKIIKDKRLRAVVPLADAKLPPEIVSQTFEPNSGKLLIKLKNRGGGFGGVRVFVNDKLAIADARNEKLKVNPNLSQEFVDLTVNLSGSAFAKGKICEIKNGKEECNDNKITVYTSNYLAAYKTSNITSKGTSVYSLSNNNNDFSLPTLYAIVGGVSDYAGNDLDLKFAAKDAEDFSNALGLGARQLFCAKENPNCLDKVNITTLSTSGKAGTILPTKENFRKAFAEIARKAEPSDIVLVYLSGHGVSLDDTDTYFYLTADAASTSKEDLTKNFAKISITSN